MRAVIDSVAARVCPSCASPCCRYHYCRPTARNPWYAFVNHVAGTFEVPEDWERRRDAFGLGRGGCEIRAGRYVFCYSYNCPRMLAALPGDPARRAFEELSDLLLAANRLPEGRLLHELGPGDSLTSDHLRHIETATAAAARRLDPLTEGISHPPRWPRPGGSSHGALGDRPRVLSDKT
ncbi:MAG: hypothetical protein HZB55_22350 [Deltaproteobacteria bacterium]|nr:hypothetical protein [Deltaproteobacteria bacterium]